MVELYKHVSVGYTFVSGSRKTIPEEYGLSNLTNIDAADMEDDRSKVYLVSG